MNNNSIFYFIANIKDEKNIKKLLKLIGGDKSNFDIKKFIVAKDKNKIIGCVRIKALGKDCLELSSLAVLPDYQGRGVGSQLMNKILETEKKRPIFLLTSSNHELYYKKFGANIISPKLLPKTLYQEYLRIIDLSFAKNLKVIAMFIK